MNTTVTIPNSLILSYADRVGYAYPYENDEEGNQIEVSPEELEAHKLAWAKEVIFGELIKKVTDPAVRQIKSEKLVEANTEAEAFKSQVEAQITIK